MRVSARITQHYYTLLLRAVCWHVVASWSVKSDLILYSDALTQVVWCSKKCRPKFKVPRHHIIHTTSLSQQFSTTTSWLYVVWICFFKTSRRPAAYLLFSSVSSKVALAQQATASLYLFILGIKPAHKVSILDYLLLTELRV